MLVTGLASSSCTGLEAEALLKALGNYMPAYFGGIAMNKIQHIQIM